jgi:hypothetical protein
MKGWRQLVHGIVVLAAACLWAWPLQAQQDEGQKPKPAAKEYPPLLEPGDKQQDADEELQKMQPDNGPLGGIQNPTLGTTEMRHSYWVPGIEYSNTVRSNSANVGTNSGWGTTSYLSANTSLLAAWSHSVLSANFSGGGLRMNFSSTRSNRLRLQEARLSTRMSIIRKHSFRVLVKRYHDSE